MATQNKNIRVGVENQSAFQQVRNMQNEQKRNAIDAKKAASDYVSEIKNLNQGSKEYNDSLRKRVELERESFNMQVKQRRNELGQQRKSGGISEAQFKSRMSETESDERNNKSYLKELEKVFNGHLKGTEKLFSRAGFGTVGSVASQAAGGDISVAGGAGMAGKLGKLATNPYALAAALVLGGGVFHAARGLKMDSELGQSQFGQMSGLGFRGNGLSDYVGGMKDYRGRMNNMGYSVGDFFKNSSQYGKASGGMLGKDSVMSLMALDKASLLDPSNISQMQNALRYETKGSRSGGIMRAIQTFDKNSVLQAETFSGVAGMMNDLGSQGMDVDVNGLLSLQAFTKGAGFEGQARSNVAGKLQAGSNINSDNLLRAVQFQSMREVGGGKSRNEMLLSMEKGWGDETGAAYNKKYIGNLLKMSSGDAEGATSLMRAYGLNRSQSTKLMKEYQKNGLEGYGEDEYKNLVGKSGGFEGEAGKMTSTKDIMTSIKESVDVIAGFITEDKAAEKIIDAFSTEAKKDREERKAQRKLDRIERREAWAKQGGAGNALMFS